MVTRYGKVGNGEVEMCRAVITDHLSLATSS